MGPQARQALPLLTEVARTKGHKARGAALGALGPVGMPAAELLPILTEALTDSPVRNAAASALRDLGGAARPALPELRRHLKDPDDNVRNAVTDAVNRIEAEPAGVLAPPRRTAAEEF
jgi:HEAT repeat protein